MKTVSLSVVDFVVLCMFFCVLVFLLIVNGIEIENRLDRIIELLEKQQTEQVDNPPPAQEAGDE